MMPLLEAQQHAGAAAPDVETDAVELSWIASDVPPLRIALHHVVAAAPSRVMPVLVVHGATFPAANAAAWRIGGRCWLDVLAMAGHSAYALDFLGFGRSDRYPGMLRDPGEEGDAADSIDTLCDQLGRAVDHVLRVSGSDRLHLIAHSAGTLVAARYAQHRPERIARLVLFGAPSPATTAMPTSSAPERFLQFSAADQWQSFEARVREQHHLDAMDFAAWSARYLAGDPQALQRDPPGVRVPSGLMRAVHALGISGQLPYAPERLHCPTLLIQGEWDAVSPPAATARVFERVAASCKRFVVLARGGHRLHLEAARVALYRAVNDFLDEEDAS